MMGLHEEIAKTAFELYEKSGRMDGRDMENWLEAEKIVKARRLGEDLNSNIQKIAEKSEGLMHAAREVVKVTLHELSLLTRKIFK